MTGGDTEVLIVGGGAAGIAAARRLADAGVSCLIVEARSRLGGRAWTIDAAGYPIDLGCGWLHSADTNPWREIAEHQGRQIDRTVPPWARPSLTAGFPLEAQREFRTALGAYHDRLAEAGEGDEDRPATSALEPGGRWNSLIGAVTTYLSGTEAERLSAVDFARYDDSGVNWRVTDGYGTAVVGHAAGLPAILDCAVRRIDHGGRRIRVETAKGDFTADAVILSVPSALIAEEAITFSPALPRKVEAAAGLPLGLADKLFLSLDGAEEFEKDSRLFGHIDRTATGTYHVRPFGRPIIEGYFGGSLAGELEAAGEHGFFDFALGELTERFGNAFAKRVRPINATAWRGDPFARGSYSYALPGRADDRAVLAEPVDGRLFFAGEACSAHDFSTAHGAYLTGIAAAEAIIAARSPEEVSAVVA